jgi:hypothetical protein
MDTKEARRLKVGSRIYYQAYGGPSPKEGNFGTVTKRLPMGFEVLYDDGWRTEIPNVHADAIWRVGHLYLDPKCYGVNPAAKDTAWPVDARHRAIAHRLAADGESVPLTRH